MSIPQWVIDYNNAGHQSGAGRAVRLLIEELASLREQLKQSNFELKAAKTSIEFRDIQLQQQEEVIRELIESIHALIKSGYCIHSSIRQAAESSVLKAKSLTTKEK